MFNEIKTVLSTDENVVKFVFTTTDAVAEAVLYKYPTYEDRTVICCSTQSGCPVGCVFCGTGKFFTRNLTADEIVQQIKTAVDHTGIDPVFSKKFQIMFMSMGEPLLNIDAVIDAIEMLSMMYPNADLLVSTSLPSNALFKHGISAGNMDTSNLDKLVSLARIFPKIGLQISLHESTDQARTKLIPTNTATIFQISQAAKAFLYATGRKAFLNYCVHEGNSSDVDIQHLLAAFHPNECEFTLSVICEKDQSMKNAIEEKVAMVVDFASRMGAVGYSTRVFNPAGQDDIGGGCGQLWFVQEWAKKHKNEDRTCS